MASTAFQVQNNSILVEGFVNGIRILFIIDTGDAIGPVFNTQDAQTLNLPDLGPLGVSGAGGAVQIAATEANIILGGKSFPKEPSAIDPNLQGPSLLGLPFFLKQGGTLAFDFDNGQLSFGRTVKKKRGWLNFFAW